MGVRISDPRHVTIYCSVTGRAFGPVFGDSLEAEEFLRWLPGDAREYTTEELESQYREWLTNHRHNDDD
jgi:hypothetical protein